LEKSSGSFSIFCGQFSPPEYGGCRGGSGEPIKLFGKLQDSFPCARIGQLPSHLTRLFRAVEPLQGFVQNRWHSGPPSIAVPCSRPIYLGNLSA
jgi:hypothetical protein